MNEFYPQMNLYRRVVQAKLFIDKNYPDSINVDDIAGEAAFSKFHFIRLFKKIYGSTPHQYLRLVRLRQARRLLKSEMPVEEVCFSVGFDSVSSFSGLFKRMVGSTPSGYQRHQVHLKKETARQPMMHIPACHRIQYVQESNFEEVK